MIALRDTVALTPCHWCGWDRPDALHAGHFFTEDRRIIECIDAEACDARLPHHRRGSSMSGDPLRPARGVLNALALSAVFWAVVALAAWAITR